jgi:hypothetical protein
MMTRIKRLSHLRSEQKRLRNRKADLEKAIRQDWGDLWHHFQPASLAREALGSWTAWLGNKLLEGRQSVDEKITRNKK